MSEMFQGCNELESLTLNFETSKVINMSYMFNECYNIKEIKGIETFNTINVTDMSVMFKGCKELKSLQLNFDTMNVNNMEFMFTECNKLKEIKGIENFKTTNIIKYE